MSTKSIRKLISINNENPVKNTKNSLITNRKKTALKVLTNTVQSIKKSDGEGLKPCFKQQKILKPMKIFEIETKSKSLQDNSLNEEFSHFDCTIQEKDFLPPSMTCNIGMLSDFFNSKNDNENDWFLEDYSNTMIHKIRNTFEDFGEPDVEEYNFPSLPVMDFPEILSF